MIKQFSKKILFFLLIFLLGVSLSHSAEESEQKISVQNNHGFLSNWLLYQIKSWHNKNVDAVEEHYHKSLEKKFGEGIEKVRNAEYDPICKITWNLDNGDLLNYGTGVLIAHPNDHQKKLF